MATSGVSGFGTVLVWNYHKILELSNIGGVSQTRGTIDVSSHDSPSSFKEYVSGMADGGELPIEGNFISGDANGQIKFHTDLQAGTKRYAYIVFPMSLGGSLEAYAIGTGFNMSFPIDDKLGISGSLKLAGKPSMYLTQSTGMSGLTGIESKDSTALEITPEIAVGTYAYVCSVDTESTWVKLTITAGSHTIYAQGVAQTTAQQGGEITLGAAGTDTRVFIMVFETSKSPRLYKLTVTRAAAG